MMRAGILSLLFATAASAQPVSLAPGEQQTQNPITLRIGVRSDAPPFSYKPGDALLQPQPNAGDLANADYAGYMIFLCDRVLETMKERDGAESFNVEVAEVTALNRLDALRNAASADEASGDEDSPAVDILCDPATATRDRVREFSASLPLYLSGIGYAAQPRDKIYESSCPAHVGLVSSTTAIDNGLPRILEGNEWKKNRDDLLAYMHNPSGWMDTHACGWEIERKRRAKEAEDANGGQSSEADTEEVSYIPPTKPCDPGADNPCDPVDPPVLKFKTHEEAAQAFCQERIQYYVGDLEIVNRALKLFGTCDFRPAVTTYSDDRYVIFMRIPEPEDLKKAQLLMRFSQTLSELVLTQPSLLDEAFKANFAGYQPSDKLRLFFWSLYGP